MDEGYTCCTIDPRSQLLAAAGDSGRVNSGEIKLWNIQTGQILQHFRGHLSTIWNLAFSKDGKFLASCSGGAQEEGDKSVRVWDIATGSQLFAFTDYERRVTCVAFSPDGTLLAFVDDLGHVKVHDLVTNESLSAPDIGGSECIYFSPNGQFLCTEYYCWPITNHPRLSFGKRFMRIGDVMTYDGMTTYFANATRSQQDATQWYIVPRNAMLYEYDFASGRTIRTWAFECLGGSPISFYGMSITGDGHRVAMASNLGAVILNVGDLPRPLWIGNDRSGGELPINHVSLSADNRTLAGAGYKGLFVWDEFSAICAAEESRHEERGARKVDQTP